MENNGKKHVWEYMGGEYYLNICDCDTYEALDRHLMKLAAEFEEVTLDVVDEKVTLRPADEMPVVKPKPCGIIGDKSRVNVAEKMRANCGVIEEFFASVFGSEAAGVICGGKANIVSYISALVSFMGYLGDEIENLGKAGDELKREICARFGIM